MPVDFGDRTDFENAERGLVDRLDPCLVKAADGRVVWDLEAYAYLDAEGPDTANPSLWRQAQLCATHGLFQVTEGIYQVRSLVISNMISAETAAAIALYRRNRGDRPVTGVIYTHSHADHVGGVRGVLPEDAGQVPILAPEGFLEHAVSENVYAGVAMNRRATYMYGAFLDRSPTGQVSTGLGIATSEGSLSLIAPTLDITRTGQVETLDGVRIVFQITPGTEAPAEMNFCFPDRRSLCMAENATHNLLTLRGALVRDPRVWSRYLNEAIELFAADADVAFASHHWPTWGTDNIVRFLAEQRDLYAYLHDQTLRMLNNGATGMEIAEDVQLPPALEAAWHARGYYGSVSHNLKAVYQRYLGWFDSNPTSLWQHPPQAVATRYVEVIGGQQAVLDKAGPMPTPAICGSRPSCSSTPCSPVPMTRRPRTPLPRCTSASATAPRTRPGEASTSPEPWSSATGSSLRRWGTWARAWRPRSRWSSCSTPWPSGSTGCGQPPSRS
jgi:alkyl sulfatase BDS1-like metallo-beta-lactamase superfamily hydrolase